jgi:hypothetical protein
MFTVSPCSATEVFRVGQYVRMTKSPNFPEAGRETGVLKIMSSSQNNATFRLEVTMNPSATNDGFLTRNGVIEVGELSVRNKGIVYRSNNAQDKDLGVCTLLFSRSGHAIVIVQSGKCWWFGEDVNASGRYEPVNDGVVHVVR